MPSKKILRVLWYAFGIACLLVGFKLHGVMVTLNSMATFAFYYYSVVGLIGFFNWVIHYRRIKRIQQRDPGLFYLVLVREQFK